MDADALEISSLLAALGLDIAVSEVYGPGRFTSRASGFDLPPGTAYDIRTGYDFETESDRRRAEADIDAEKPLLLVGSPMCSPFSNLQHLNAAQGVDVQALARKGIQHLLFCAKLYRKQHEAGRLFLHEQPANSSSWRLWVIRTIAELPGVQYIECDQCAYGLWCTDAIGPAPVKSRSAA